MCNAKFIHPEMFYFQDFKLVHKLFVIFYALVTFQWSSKIKKIPKEKPTVLEDTGKLWARVKNKNHSDKS